MDKLLARLKPRDPHRGHVLRRFVYRGIRFEEGKGWYQVSPEVGEYLRGVRQRAFDPHSPPAFDVCTDGEAKALDAREKEGAATRASATDDIKVSSARVEGALTTEDLPEAATASSGDAKGSGRKTRKE